MRYTITFLVLIALAGISYVSWYLNNREVDRQVAADQRRREEKQAKKAADKEYQKKLYEECANQKLVVRNSQCSYVLGFKGEPAWGPFKKHRVE